jgi:hypothetical protein
VRVAGIIGEDGPIERVCLHDPAQGTQGRGLFQARPGIAGAGGGGLGEMGDRDLVLTARPRRAAQIKW